MTDRYEARQVSENYWEVDDHLLGKAISGYAGGEAWVDAVGEAQRLNRSQEEYERRGAEILAAVKAQELPEAEQTRPDPTPPYYFRVDPIGGHFEAVCSRCETTVLKIEHRMSIITPVTACGAHVCPLT